MNDRHSDRVSAETANAITDALHRYCRAVDCQDRHAFLALFSPDASVDFGLRYRGPALGFMDLLLANRINTLEMRHEITDVTIWLGGDSGGACSRATVHAQVVRQTESGIERRWIRGLYEDRWTARDGHWLLQHRRYVQLEAVSETTTNPSP